jgi:hypothetical protein
MEFLFSIVGHRFTIGLKGVIDPSFKLSTEIYKILQDNSNISEVVFVLRKVDNIDKEGIKAWEKEVKKVAEKGYSLTFIECPKSLLEVLLRIEKSGGMRAIRSFVVPYYCESCNDEFPQLINTNSMTLSFTAYSKPNCPQCGKRLSLDITDDEIDRITSLLPITDSYSDKRKYPRFDVSVYNFKAIVTRKKDNKSHSMAIVNFSEAGLCLAGRNHFEPGDNVSIEIAHQGHKVAVDGTIVWFSMEGDSDYMMGLSLWSKDIFNLLIKA